MSGRRRCQRWRADSGGGEAVPVSEAVRAHTREALTRLHSSLNHLIARHRQRARGVNAARNGPRAERRACPRQCPMHTWSATYASPVSEVVFPRSLALAGGRANRPE
ncbi:hypothetical protein JIQ42_07172 [Leishmania sp. Namibia]|uniref:hypothetical protein n=1 Tax=Leishmania sp. Namibia TaxID=2802991 RepID=UPI001B41752A|nr:hypothetical protein JIQ42_07172 [Leishmania sp. Namibia]